MHAIVCCCAAYHASAPTNTGEPCKANSVSFRVSRWYARDADASGGLLYLGPGI